MLNGCAHQIAAISPAAPPDKNAVVLYGRFSLGRDYSFGNRLALWLKILDTQKSVYIYFDADQPVYGIAVQPGRYQLAGFVGVNNTHEVKVRREFPASRLTSPFAAAAGSQIYIGDFSGRTTYDGMLSEWRIKFITNNFANTTVEFRENHPKLMTVPADSVFELQTRQP